MARLSKCIYGPLKWMPICKYLMFRTPICYQLHTGIIHFVPPAIKSIKYTCGQRHWMKWWPANYIYDLWKTIRFGRCNFSLIVSIRLNLCAISHVKAGHLAQWINISVQIYGDNSFPFSRYTSCVWSSTTSSLVSFIKYTWDSISAQYLINMHAFIIHFLLYIINITFPIFIIIGQIELRIQFNCRFIAWNVGNCVQN